MAYFSIRYYEDEREDERFFAGAGEIERDRDNHHEGEAACERDPPKQRVKKAAIIECSNEMCGVVVETTEIRSRYWRVNK